MDTHGLLLVEIIVSIVTDPVDKYSSLAWGVLSNVLHTPKLD